MKKANVSITTLATDINNTRLLLEGQLIIRNATEIKAGLLLALNSSQNLELIFKNVIKMDLAVLQLLIALQKSAAGFEKTLSIDPELPDAMKSAMQYSGFEKLLMINYKSKANGIH